jgi:hypothetical protein
LERPSLIPDEVALFTYHTLLFSEKPRLPVEDVAPVLPDPVLLEAV